MKRHKQQAPQDKRYLDWSESTFASGTAGSFPKASEGAGAGRVYYKLSRYDAYRGIYGHECVNELLASRLMRYMGIEHVTYALTQALVTVGGQEYVTWLSASKSYRLPNERKQALDVFYRLNRQESESPLELCDRMGWGLEIRRMMLVDYLICNRDRHGANIEVIRNEKGALRLAPLFDNGLSFFCSSYGDDAQIARCDVLEDLATNNFVGTSSLEENLRLIGTRDLHIQPPRSAWRQKLFEGVEEILSPLHIDAIWSMIEKRWQFYSEFRERSAAGARREDSI